MIILEFLQVYGWAISIVLQFIFSVFLLWLKDKFAPKEIVQEIENFKDDMQDEMHITDKRITAIETAQRSSPTAKDFSDLKLEICNLTGELKRNDEARESLVTHMKRMEKQLSNIDQHLRRQS